MNRGRSSDSLDNGFGNVISSSSSSTDFTSDEDLNDLYIMSGQPVKSKPKIGKILSSNRTRPSNIENKLAHQNHHGFNRLDPLASTHDICISSERPIMSTSGHSRNFIDPYSNRYDKEPYSAMYEDLDEAGHMKDNIDDPLFADHTNDQPLASILPGENYTALNGGIHQIDSTPSNPTVGSHSANLRSTNPSQNRSSGGLGENSSDCFASSSGYRSVNYMSNNLIYNAETDDKDDEENLFRRPDNSLIDPHIPAITTSSRRCATLCAGLVNCRTLDEAIEFVDINRDLMCSLTRIISEAPAYRNYDISNYMIDYPVKESFNPEFWQDREPVVTTADGNCQYHAVSISLTGSEFHTQKVRLLAALAVIDYRDWFDSILKIIDGGSVLDLVHTIARPYSWGDATTLKAIAVAIKRRIFLYTCNIGKKDYEMVKSLSKEELLDAFREKKYRGGTGIHTYADPMIPVPQNNYIMLFHKSEHFIAVLPTNQNPIMYEPYNPIVPTFS